MCALWLPRAPALRSGLGLAVPNGPSLCSTPTQASGRPHEQSRHGAVLQGRGVTGPVVRPPLWRGRGWTVSAAAGRRDVADTRCLQPEGAPLPGGRGGGAAGLSGGHSLQPRSHPLVTQANGGEEQHVPTHATPPRATGTLPRARRSHWTRRRTLPLTGNGHIAQSHSQNDGTARVLFLRQSVRIDLIPCLLEF